jgi:glycosyltransferase involved in cell wall biosynthesis
MTVTVGVSMVRNEADVIRKTALHMARQCDRLIIADNGSSDGTRQILDELARHYPIEVVDDPEVGYYQSRKMTALAERAAADHKNDDLWIDPFDGDELSCVWDDPFRPIKDLVACQEADVIEAALFDYRPTAIDPAGSDPFTTIQWCVAQPAALPKVVFRWCPGAVIHQGNHGVTIPDEIGPRETLIRINHFPYRSAEQFWHKAVQGAKAYAATDLPDDMGAHWRAYGRLYDAGGAETLIEVFQRYFWALSPTDAGLVHRPVTYLGDQS